MFHHGAGRDFFGALSVPAGFLSRFFDVFILAQFLSLQRRHNDFSVAYFDGAGGTQTPGVVVDAVADDLLNHNANTHWEYPTSHETDAIINAARATFADFLHTSADEIVFGPNTT